MKKHIILMSILLCCILAFVGCSQRDTYTISISIPAGTTEEAFFYSDEEISPHSDTLRLSADSGINETSAVLQPIEVEEENAYEPFYLTAGLYSDVRVEKGAWFKIGVTASNPSDTDKTVYVTVYDVDVRIK